MLCNKIDIWQSVLKYSTSVMVYLWSFVQQKMSSWETTGSFSHSYLFCLLDVWVWGVGIISKNEHYRELRWFFFWAYIFLIILIINYSLLHLWWFIVSYICLAVVPTIHGIFTVLVHNAVWSSFKRFRSAFTPPVIDYLPIFVKISPWWKI